MSENSSELDKRQIDAIAYFQDWEEDEMPSPEVEVSEKGNEFSFKYRGLAKVPPEIEKWKISGSDTHGYVTFYEISDFEVKNNETGKSLDVVKATPRGWSQKAIRLIDPEEIPPEIFEHFINYQDVEPAIKEIQTSTLFGSLSAKDADIAVKSILWITITAQFYEDVGEPLLPEGKQIATSAVTKRRQEVFDALSGKTDQSPQEIMNKGFKNP